MTLVRNEQKKLLANALDRASTACFTVGIATPVAGFLYNIGNLGVAISGGRLAAGIALWLFSAIALHLLARRVLKGLMS